VSIGSKSVWDNLDSKRSRASAFVRGCGCQIEQVTSEFLLQNGQENHKPAAALASPGDISNLET
jgi:hypothetical protein